MKSIMKKTGAENSNSGGEERKINISAGQPLRSSIYQDKGGSNIGAAIRKQTYRNIRKQTLIQRDIFEKVEAVRLGITMPVDEANCKLYYCPGCKEIFHDRNLPMNLTSCLHLLCQYCIKQQLQRSIKPKYAGSSSPSSGSSSVVPLGGQGAVQHKLRVTCSRCRSLKEYNSIWEVEMDLTSNFELLAMIYKNRPHIAFKARDIYAIPEENSKCIEIQLVRKHNEASIIEESSDLIEEVKHVRPLIEGVVELTNQQPQRRTLVEAIKKEFLCCKCKKEFDENLRQPNILVGCIHKICKDCLVIKNRGQVFTKNLESVNCPYCVCIRQVQDMPQSMQTWFLNQAFKKRTQLSEQSTIQKQLLHAYQPMQNGLSGLKSSRRSSSALLDFQMELFEQNNHYNPRGSSNVQNVLVSKCSSSNMVKDSHEEHHNYYQDHLDNIKRVKKLSVQLRKLTQRLADPLAAPENQDFSCTVCGDQYSTLNRPIIILKCACSKLHQQCEMCFRMRSLNQLTGNLKQFFLYCPETRIAGEIETDGRQTNPEVFEYLISMKTVAMVNQQLLEQIKQNQPPLDSQHEPIKEAEIEFTFQGSLQQILENQGAGEDPQGRPGAPKIPSIIKGGAKQNHQQQQQQQQYFEQEFDHLTKCATCKYEFYDGERLPGLMKCGHNICYDCLEKVYKESRQQDDGENTVEIKCDFDQVITQFLKGSGLEGLCPDGSPSSVASLLQKQQRRDSFQDFWGTSVPPNLALLNFITFQQEKQKSRKTVKGAAMYNFDTDLHNYFDLELLSNHDENLIEKEETAGPGLTIHVDNTEAAAHKTLKQSVKMVKIEQQNRIIEAQCPICNLFYTNDNPPVNLQCVNHPEKPYVLCRNDFMAFYFMKGGKRGPREANERDLTVSCPHCQIGISLAVAGKTEVQVLAEVDINRERLERNYTDDEIVRLMRMDGDRYSQFYRMP